MSSVRASDADRQQVAEALRSHFAAGRLQADDLEQRVQIALAATTIADLQALTDDLPASAPPLPATGAGRPVKVGGWGNLEFRQEHVLPSPRIAAWQQTMTDIAPAMAAYGYAIVASHEPDFIVFELAGSRVAVSLVDLGDNHTRLVAAGTARRPVRKAFAGLSA
jgi:Domain of unknown function (DUF1707)